MVLDGNNRPVVAWEDYDSDNVRVAWWTGSTYQRLGDPSILDHSIRPAIMMDASGAPVVSFVELGGSSDCVRTRRWNGTAWADLGGPVCLQNYNAWSMASVLDKQGRPLIAVMLRERFNNDARVHVYRFNGVAWEQVGDAVRAVGAAASGMDMDSGQPVIAVDPSDRIVVAWEEHYWEGALANKAYAHVFRRNNGQWVRVGTQLPSLNAWSRHPSLAIASNGTVWVAYIKDNATAVVREQNGAWAATSTTGLRGCVGPVSQTKAPLLRIDGAGTPMVLLLEEQEEPFWWLGRFLRKWNGTAWVPLDNRSGTLDATVMSWQSFTGANTDMAFALTSTGQPVVALPAEAPWGANYGDLRIRTLLP